MLKTAGLGSCVGVALYDERMRIAGLAHVMLPSSSIAREAQLNVAKYADTAIPALIVRMVAAGASADRLVAKMAGGAQMFSYSGSEMMRIGQRNVESCTAALQEAGIEIAAEDTGGSWGRTIEFDSLTGIMTIRSVQLGTKEI
ncbi:chemotaxis protein CheD [Paenibacillus cisolokensis]|uniref:chemotaxis protein CheD n=1 Tax=Paenibacillus cisolokensis TaxID=1658519 RepID=UPI001FD2AAB8|nr:chemotaxis protein CheD [Paenibacillus cisolokensis]